MFTDIRRHYCFSPDQAVVVPVAEEGSQAIRLACLEPRQSLGPDALGVATMYVLEGSGVVTVGDRQEHASAGSLAVADPLHPVTLNNPGPGRLVALVVSCST